MFGKTNKKLLKEFKELKRDFKELKELLLNVNKDNNIEEKESDKVISTSEGNRATCSSRLPLRKYYEEHLNDFKYILKAREQKTVDQVVNYGLTSATVIVLANLIKKGYSFEKIGEEVGVDTRTIQKYCYRTALLGYFGRTLSESKQMIPGRRTRIGYFVNMSYFDTVK